MARFRLLAGKYVQADESKEPLILTDAKGREYKKYPSKVYVKGDVVESATDLVDRFGNDKFRLLSGRPSGNAKRSESAKSLRPHLLFVGRIERKVRQPEPEPEPLIVEDEEDGSLVEDDESNDDAEETELTPDDNASSEDVSNDEVTDEQEEGDDESINDEEEEELTDEESDREAFGGMTGRELRNYARSNKINLGGCSSKEQVIDRIIEIRHG